MRSAGIIIIILFFSNCTKDTGKNPSLAYSDQALADSCNATYHHYYKNKPEKTYSRAAGSNAQHGPFKLRFNTVAYNALQDSGRLPVKVQMPEGALVIKDIYSGSEISLRAIMYKHAGGWLWAEIKPDKQVQYSVLKNPDVCVNCHSQQGNRDFLRTFNFY